MSEKYLPLFRKYRPQSFKDVVGQENLVKALSNAIELNKIANAYLFSGPRGTGKTSTARIFAKSLNCKEGPTLTPCQKCPSCLDITNTSGLDVIEIDAATNRGIDDAKELIAQTQYAPMNGKYKIFIIDEVHMLSNEAFNALLKTFEEPPANVIFILATTEPHKVIETIVSRCQRFDLRRITTDDITKRLREVSDLENIKITDDALYTIARNVSGGLRDSLALLDQVSILGAKEEITRDDIENLLGKMTFDVSVKFLEKILSKDTKSAVSYVDEIYNRGLEPKNFCENFIEFLRNVIFALSTDKDKEVLKLTNFNLCDIEKIKELNLDSAHIFKILNKSIEYYKEVRYATNPYLWVELMVINLCRIDDIQAAQNQQMSVAPKIAPSIKMQPEACQIQPAQTESLVKETLKEISIPDSEVVKEAPKKNEPEHLLEYKENLYETKKVEAAPKPQAVEEKPANNVVLPKVPGVDDEPYAENAQTKPVEPVKKDAPPQQPLNNSGSESPAIMWAKVLSVIESIPAKFFYSGVGKLIKIDNKRVVLGFINENVVNQAKSDSKFKHLDKAIKSVLGEDFSSEFILMTPDIKPIEVKLTAKIQPASTQKSYKQSYTQSPAPVQKQTQPDSLSGDDIEKEMLSDMNLQTEEPKASDVEIVEKEDKKPSGSLTDAHYGKKTKEMLEAFNGKVIE